MKKYLLLIVFAFSLFAGFAQEKDEEVTTYYLIRHAEKDRSDKTNKDADLLPIGNERATRWSKIFENVSFDMVYTTDFNRTKQTASPTAQSKNLELLFYNPKIMYDEGFQKATKGKTVLVVGHSNTTPFFANAILEEKKYQQIDDHNNANLYIVTVTNATKTSVLLKVN